MSIVGIDQSLSATGICEIDNSGKILRIKTIKTKGKKGVERLDFITNEIKDFCLLIKDKYVVVREGYSYGYAKSPFISSSCVFDLGELGGCIDLELYRLTNSKMYGYYIIPTTVMKKFCLGQGGTKKDTSYLLSIYDEFKIKFDDDNQADAFMLANTILGFIKITNDEDFYNNLTPIKKEAIMSSFIGKKGSGITKTNIKKIQYLDFVEKTKLSLNEYLYFKKDTAPC